MVEASPPSPGRQPLNDDQRKAIAAALDDLPVHSAVALRAMRQTEDPDWDLQTLNATIRNDQGLVARFLRLANSAFFGVRCTITTLDRAINLVGIKRVRSVLLTAPLEGLHDTKTSNFTGPVLWETTHWQPDASASFSQRDTDAATRTRRSSLDSCTISAGR